MAVQEYKYEAIRAFIVKRPWMGESLLPDGKYQMLKDRTLEFKQNELKYIEAFIDGYKCGRSIED